MVELMTPELVAELHSTEAGGPLYRAALTELGRKGWLGIGWPEKYGGQGRSPMEQFIFADEVQRAGFPLPFLTINTVGPALARFGTDAQRDEFLPRILRGEIHFSIGYTEPSAGTDLAALETRAERDGDHYVINGQKVFTSLADHADYIWLAARTDPDAPKHKGISIFIVDVNLPGVQITPTRTMGENQVATTFYADVRVPAGCLVGNENGGWNLITTQLNHERVSLVSVGISERLLEETTRWAADTVLPDGSRWLDRPWVRRNLASVEAHIEVMRLMNWKQAWQMGRGALDPAQASALKVFGSEFYVEGYRLLMEVLGQSGCLRSGSPGAALAGRVERMYRSILVLTFGGGTNEVQRDIISTVGLGLPRAGA